LIYIFKALIYNKKIISYIGPTFIKTIPNLYAMTVDFRWLDLL